MRTSEPKTPLLALLRALTAAQRAQLAADSRTSVSYLYALGGCQRRRCGADKAALIEAATRKMTARTRGATAVITAADLGTMCAECRQ